MRHLSFALVEALPHLRREGGGVERERERDVNYRMEQRIVNLPRTLSSSLRLSSCLRFALIFSLVV